MDKRFWAVIGVLIAVFVGIMIFSNNDKAGAPTGDVGPTNHLYGENKKGITLVEYGDFECRFCVQYFPIVEQVKEKYKQDIAFQFRNLPLQQVHQNAFAASRAAEAADKQGKFWEMYTLLYQNQPNWEGSNTARATFEGYARDLGLNIDKFKTDFASEAVNDVINADIAEFKKTGEKISTPTFFLNGKKISPDGSVESFSKIIDEAIAEKDKQ